MIEIFLLLREQPYVKNLVIRTKESEASDD